MEILNLYLIITISAVLITGITLDYQYKGKYERQSKRQQKALESGILTEIHRIETTAKALETATAKEKSLENSKDDFIKAVARSERQAKQAELFKLIHSLKRI